MHDRASTTSAVTTRREVFRQRIISRDGGCVMTGAAAEHCEACHIIPHSKGDEVCSEYLLNDPKNLLYSKYIMNLANDRNPTLVPPFDGINDSRNGLLLHSSLHNPFEASRIAFLRVGNFNAFLTIYC